MRIFVNIGEFIVIIDKKLVKIFKQKTQKLLIIYLMCSIIINVV